MHHNAGQETDDAPITPVGVLARGVQALELIRDRGALTLTEIAVQTGLHKSTVHRLLNTLLELGLLERDRDSQRYHLGLELLTYGYRVISDLQIRQGAIPHLERLQETSQQSVLLSTLHRGKVLWLDILRTQWHPYRMEWGGETSYAHCTSAGKAMLAYLPDQQIEHVCCTVGMPRQTENTITTLAALREDLARTRERGYAIERAENLIRLCCIAAPIFGRDDKVAGAISISVPISRFKPEFYLPLVPELKKACQDISRSMGASRRAVLLLMVDG